MLAPIKARLASSFWRKGIWAEATDTIILGYTSTKSSEKDYKLTKFLRSNHGTCINQRPIVAVGDRVRG